MMGKKWKVDPCQEGGGGWTVRLDDGSKFGDINRDPVATFNRREDADKCAQAHNSHDDLVHALNWLLSAFYGGGEGGPEAMLNRQRAAAINAEVVLHKHGEVPCAKS